MPASERDAAIFFPGLGEWIDQSLESIANLMVIALNGNDPPERGRFSLRPQMCEEMYTSRMGVARKTRVMTIARGRDGQPDPFLDIYEADYRPTMISDYQHQNSLVQSWRLLRLFVTNTPRLLLAAFSPGKSRIAKGQFYIALFGVALLVVYMAILLGATIGIVSEVLGGLNVSLPDFSQWLVWLQPIVVLVALAQALWPKMQGLFSSTALELACAVEYITYGRQRRVMISQLNDLLTHLTAQGVYRKIHLISYSFGTVVALDSLFPIGNEPGLDIEQIDTLVTIGCPFDMFRLVWPDYFRNRQKCPDRPRKWFNVYMPADIFSSNFRNDDTQLPADRGLGLSTGGDSRPEILRYEHGPDQLQILAALALAGVRAHGEYWEVARTYEVGCFSAITKALFAGASLPG